MDEKNDQTKIWKGVVSAQAMGLAAQMILSELILRWAIREDNPAHSLRGMFESISGRLDRQTAQLGGQEALAVSEARQLVGTIFSSVDQHLVRWEQRDKKEPDQK